MNKAEYAVACHDKGFNCAQAVLSCCREYTGLDERTSLAIAGGLGGGCRCGEICGAVTGAVLAVSACCPYIDSTDLETKEKIASLSRYLTGEFKSRFGHLRCEELKGFDHSCAEFIAFCAELAEKTIQEKI